MAQSKRDYDNDVYQTDGAAHDWISGEVTEEHKHVQYKNCGDFIERLEVVGVVGVQGLDPFDFDD